MLEGMMQPESRNPETPRDLDAVTDVAMRAADRARQMLNAGESRDKILAMLANAAEDVSGKGAVCSILVLDSDGLLRNGASPNLPADYLKSIDRLKPNPQVGTCSAAAATGSVVVTCDFRSDDKWAELRHLPLALGFVGHGACRSKQSMERCWGPSELISGSADRPFRKNYRASECSPRQRGWSLRTRQTCMREQPSR